MHNAEEFKSRLRHLDLEELCRMATTDRSQFSDEAVAMLEAELAHRGVTRLTLPDDRRLSLEGKRPGDMQYAGFWRRFGALWLDALILLAVSLVPMWLSAQSRYMNALFVLPNLVLGLWYHVYLVKWFAGTPGKLALNLRICRVDGTPVGFREAFLRYIVDMVLSGVIATALAISALGMSDLEYQSLSFMTRGKYLVERAPGWYRPTSVVFQVWVWSEFVVMLTNQKRRAIHDFMAGTVVVRQASA